MTTKQPYQYSGNYVQVTPEYGVQCWNRLQFGGKCADFEVRFCCQIDQTPCEGKWTEWFDFDEPDGVGDFETLDMIQSKHPSAICERPLAVSVKTDGNQAPTGLKLHMSAMLGLTILKYIYFNLLLVNSNEKSTMGWHV